MISPADLFGDKGAAIAGFIIDQMGHYRHKNSRVAVHFEFNISKRDYHLGFPMFLKIKARSF